MNYQKIRKGCIIVLFAAAALLVMLYWVGGEQFHYRDDKTDMVTPSVAIGEIIDGKVVTQRLNLQGDIMTGITIMPAKYQEDAKGNLAIFIRAGNTTLLAQQVSYDQLLNNSKTYIQLDTPVEIPEDGVLTLEITSDAAETKDTITLYGGNTISASRTEISLGISEEDRVCINGVPQEIQLSTEIYTRTAIFFGNYYWYCAGAFLALLLFYCLLTLHQAKKGKQTAILRMVQEFTKYRFLMKQLIARDFKTKYKRSILGVMWSFLNPLLTMLVQYLVFSTLFKSNIENFALYLLVGIVCFSFFSEATSMSLTSVVGNASLITKVYVPKYIYPLSRVTSSLVNFGFSLIPLFAVMFATGAVFSNAILLLPLGIICLFLLSLGVGLLLASLMVFFRDMQFLWGVISMLWMYATPIFYPESILPEQFLPIFKLNPLYHVIRFIRIILLDGVSPEPKAYFLMIIACVVPFLIGHAIFKRTEDKFILYI